MRTFGIFGDSLRQKSKKIVWGFTRSHSMERRRIVLFRIDISGKYDHESQWNLQIQASAARKVFPGRALRNCDSDLGNRDWACKQEFTRMLAAATVIDHAGRMQEFFTVTFDYGRN